jgi:PAS domain S-box-containing protein
VTKSIGSSVKITKNKNAENELKNKEELLRTTLDSSFDYLQVFKAVRDRHGKIIDFIWILNNRNLIEMIGDRVGKSLLQSYPGLIETGLFNMYVQVTETGISQTSEFYYDREGLNDWFHQTIIKLNDGFILTGQIITERKKIEQEVYQRTIELKESKELLQSITEAIPDMVSVQEYPSRKIIYFNREPYGISGLNVDELAKKTLEERHKLVHPEDIDGMQKYSDSFKTLPNYIIATNDYRVLNRLNEWIWLRARGKVFERDEKGNVTSIVVVVQDITAQKKAEKELNSLNSELRSFSSITANNYNEALRHVYINLETIITSDARHLSDSGRANIRRAQSAIQKMKLLTNDIHNYLELYDAGIKKELISPKITLQDIIKRIKEKTEEANAKIEFEELPALSADPLLFSRLITNLIDNSIKFKKPGEDPVVKIKHTKLNELKNAPFLLLECLTQLLQLMTTVLGLKLPIRYSNFSPSYLTRLNTKVRVWGFLFAKK